MTILAHRVDGQGEPLLLLNGGMMSMAAWDAAVAALAGTYRIVRCDFRGQLMSLSLGDPPSTLQGHAEDLAALLDALDLPRVHVVGTSFGGLVAMQFAAHFASRVQALVIVTAADVFTPDNEYASAALREAIANAMAGGDGTRVIEIMAPATFSPSWLESNREVFEARRALFSLLPPAWFAGLTGLLDSLAGLDLRPELKLIHAPTLVVGAERDRVFSVDRSYALAAAIDGAKLQIVPGAPHGWVAEDPEGFAFVVRTFLSDLPRGGRS